MPYAHPLMKPLSALVLLSLSLVLFCARPAAAVDFMFKATVDGEKFEGKPLAWTDSEMHLLGRDGRLHEFNPKSVKNAQKTSPSFYGYSFPEMRRELYREFGDSMEMTTTKHYIVLHPRGNSAWAARFEDLYRSCVAYFRVRGFTPEEPKFPLVAVVYRNRDEYFKAASERGSKPSSTALGHYENYSNRVQLFDASNGKDNGEWSSTADTIIHEATHQTAFNVGIHNRFAVQPKWLVEGLAMMFEARGVWNAQSFSTLHDRINQERWADFRANLKERKPGTFGNTIASEQLFEADVAGAYAEAWAMVLFLCETRPRELAKYLELTASRPDFSDYFAAQRVSDFAECFGGDFKILEANFLSWMSQLK
jgi:Protein of unknown function (DUF1570)